MSTLELQGWITENGELDIQLPAGLPAGKVIVRIEMSDNQADWEDRSWTDDEIKEMIKPRRKTMEEVMAWRAANPPAEEWGRMRPEDDPAQFIHILRHKSSLLDPALVVKPY